jgi:hypothetical protein
MGSKGKIKVKKLAVPTDENLVSIPESSTWIPRLGKSNVM